MKPRTLKILALSFLLELTLLLLPSHAAPGDVDLSFAPGSGIDGSVNSVAVQPDGKLIMGGGFRTINGLVRHGIARLHADGSGDASFNAGTGATGVGGGIVVLQPDGRVLAGGDFTAANGTDRTLVARLNGDGSRDGSFNSAIGAETDSGGLIGGVLSIALQPDGKVLIAGGFTTVNATDRMLIARLNADGSLDSGFTPGTGAFLTIGAVANSVAVQPDGKVLIGGFFTTVNGTARYGLARLNADGGIDTSFNPDTGTNRQVKSIAVQADGKVLIGGSFYTPSTGVRANVIRLNTNGSVDSSFNQGIGPNSGVRFLAAQADGKVLIVGEFTTVNNISRNFVARLNANGTLDNSFDPGTGANYFVDTVVLQPDGKAVIAGQFASVNGAVRTGIARLNVNGSPDSSFIPGAGVFTSFSSGASVNSLAAQPDGKVLIGGFFYTINGASHNSIARLNADGSLDSSFNPGTDANGQIYALSVQPDGKVLIGGFFYAVNGTSRTHIARLNADGSLDDSFNPGTGPDQVIFSVALQPDGKVLIGGRFTTVNGSPRNKIARLNADGSLDTTFATGAGGSGTVYSIAVQPDDKILTGGHYIARLKTNGSFDATFDPGTGVNDLVRCMVVQPDGRVLIGGDFTTIDGASIHQIARLNTDGSRDSTFDPGTGPNDYVFSVALQSDGKVLIGGKFTSFNGTTRKSLARLNADGSLENSFDPGTMDGGRDTLDGRSGTAVNSLSVQPDGKIVIGGNFTLVNGVALWRVARLLGDFLPALDIGLSHEFVILSWPGTGLNFHLQETTDLSLSNSWSPVTQPALTNAGQISVTVPVTGGQKFFRLKSQ